MTRDEDEEIALSDYYKMAVLNKSGIPLKRGEYREDRYYGFYEPNARKEDPVTGKKVGKTAIELLDDYESGRDGYRDFVAAITRVKDKIFETERSRRMGEARRK